MGDTSAATGSNSLALGRASSAGGTHTNAGTTAIGSGAQAGAGAAGQINSTAVGVNASANAVSSSAFGLASIASGNASLALGALSMATGPSGIAVGLSSNAGGTKNNASAIAIGFGAQAGAGPTAESKAIALGASAKANAASALALGAGATASQTSSVAIGSNSVANVANAVSVGSVGHERRIMNVATAVKPTDAVNLGQVKALIANGSPPAPLVAAASKRPTLAVTSGGSTRKGPASMINARVNAGQRTAALTAAGGSFDVQPASDNSPLRGSAKANATIDDEESLEPSTIVGWANVGHDGGLSGSRNITGNARHGIGNYEIVFKKVSLGRCTYNATLAGIGLVSVAAGSLANSLKVETRNHNGVLTDTGFYLMAVC
jgi:autotransporter adhesin